MRSSWRILGALAATSVAAVSVPLLTGGHADAAKFTMGHVVVYRVGSGAALSNVASAPVFLDEYDLATGATSNTVALPTVAADGNEPLTAVGLSRSEGLISRSADGTYLAVTGYDAQPASTGANGTSLTTSKVTTVPRVVGLVDGNGIADTSTTLTSASTPQLIRSALTDGDRIWATGGNGGVLTTTLGSPSTTTVAGTATSNLTSLTAQGGGLFTGGILADRVAQVGSGLPASGASFTDLTGLPTNLLTYGYGFADLDPAKGLGSTGLDTLYVANASVKAGAIQKYRYDGSTWKLAGSVDLDGVTGLVTNVDGGNVSIAATTPDGLWKLLDTGAATSTLAGSATKVASAPAGTEFRGVALAPTAVNGPSTYVRSPATGASLSLGSDVTVSAYVAEPAGATLTSVTVSAGSVSATATKGSGTNVWTATLPAAGLSAGPTTVTVTAKGSDGTTTVNRTVTLTKPATPPTPTPTPTPAPTTPVALVPANALTAGSFAPSDAKVTRTGAWKAYASKGSPTKKGLAAKKKGATLTATVSGSALTLVFDATKASGQVSITVDGKKTVVDLFSPKAKAIKKKLKLGSGTHTVTITVLGTKKKSSTGTTVSVSALQVTA
jgi:hypothetical protein